MIERIFSTTFGVGVLESVARNVKLEVTAEVGVPEITPVLLMCLALILLHPSVEIAGYSFSLMSRDRAGSMGRWVSG